MRGIKKSNPVHRSCALYFYTLRRTLDPSAKEWDPLTPSILQWMLLLAFLNGSNGIDRIERYKKLKLTRISLTSNFGQRVIRSNKDLNS